MYHTFNHSSVDGHLDCFHVLAIVSSAVMNTVVRISFWVFFSRYGHKSGIVESFSRTNGTEQMANKHMERHSTSLIIREMQIKTTVQNHLIPFRMAIIKKPINNKYWRECREKGILLHCYMVQSLWRTVRRLL